MRGTTIVLGVIAFLSTTAGAADRPIAAARLVVKARAQKQLAFVSRDPGFLFQAIGGPDDPATGGAIVELFSANEGPATLAIPAGAGNPGWKVVDAATDAFTYRNAAAPAGPSPVRAAVLRQGRVLKLTARDLGLPLAGALGSMGIRVTTGTLRSCALFDAATIVADVAGKFVARNAVAAALADCSTVALGGTTTTTTSSTATSSTSTSSTTTTTTMPGPPVCGNGVVEGAEQCDPPDPGSCFPGYACGATGAAVECQCCVASGQGGPGGCNILPCCDPDDQCLIGPDSGLCVSTLCDTPGQTCLATQACEGGICCVPLHASNPGYTPLCQGLGVTFPCCGAATCTKPSGLLPGGLECCLPAGQGCTTATDCCSSSCNGGATCDP